MQAQRRKPQALTELKALEILALLPQPAWGKKGLGIGDDAAIVPQLGTGACWTVDSCEEGSHFELSWMRPEDVAHKALQAAISDVAAMGAVPNAMLCHVTLSPAVDSRFFRRFVSAQAEISRQMNCPIVGGNLSTGKSLTVVTTVLGSAPQGRAAGPLGFLSRRGAKPGDEVWLVGSVGWARLGLHCLRSGQNQARGAARRALLSFRRPEALVRRGLELRGRASACLDVSDGLARDATTLSTASGVKIVLEEQACLDLLTPAFIRLSLELGLDPLEAALQGGEDYALLATGPSRQRPPFAARIGNVERGEGAHLQTLSGGLEHLRGGFLHGQKPERRARRS